LIGGSIGSFSAKIVGLVVAFGLQVLLARYAGIADYGKYVLVLAWINALALFGRLGFDSSVIRLIPRYQEQQAFGHLKGILLTAIAVPCLVGLLLAWSVSQVTQTWLGDAVGLVGAFRWGSVALPMAVLSGILANAGLGLGRPVVSQYPELLIRPVLIGAAVLTFSAPGQLSAADIWKMQALAWVVSVFASSILVARWMGATVRAARAVTLIPDWVKVSLPLLAISASYHITSQSDTIMVGTLIDPQSAGVYSAASRFAGLIQFGLVAVQMVAAPMISGYFSSQKVVELSNLASSVATISIWFAAPAALFIIVFGDFLLGMFGSEFKTGYQAMVILAVAQFINSATGACGYLATMTDGERFAAKIIGMAAVLNIALNFVLIPIWGISGAAIGTAASGLTWNIVLARRAYRKIAVKSWVTTLFLRGI
jgi:O-antigen/teichoic acid export membrane protein